MSYNTTEILRKTPLPSMEQMTIQSEVLDPVISTKTLVRFQVPRAGILRSGSLIKFKVKSATDTNCYFPLHTGAFAMFDRVELTLGGKRIQSVDRSALYNTIKRQCQTQDYKYGIDMPTKGCVDRLCSSTANDGTMMVRDGVETTNNSTIPEQYRITSTNPTEFSVKMDELFPMLEDLSLPLGNLNENLFVNLYLNVQDRTTTETNTHTEGPIGLFTPAHLAVSQVVEADLTSFQLVADILYFSEERQAQLAEAMMMDQGITVLTDDVITIVNQQPQVVNPVIGDLTTGERQQNIQLSLQGLSVKSVIVADRNLSDESSKFLLGDFTSQAYSKPNSLQLRLNDLLVYPKPITNEQLKIKEVGDVFSEDFNVASSEYSFNQISTKSQQFPLDNKIISDNKTFMSRSCFDGLAGNSHFEGISVAVPRAGRQGTLSKTMAVLERTTYPSVALSTNDKREITVFAGVEKMVSFRNGALITVV